MLLAPVALAQPAEHAFDRTGLAELAFHGQRCTGFWSTPSWRCEALTIPAYLRRAEDTQALVLISHGSQGLDKRHSDYARQLADNGINAVVIGHWEARGLSQVHHDFDRARRMGGDSPNQALDVLAVAAQLRSMPPWSETKFGHLGESMGGTTAMNLTRPWLQRAFASLDGQQPVPLSALVALYGGCSERNTAESFLPLPLLFLHGADDDNTLASDCQKQVSWMNGRGGSAEITVLPGQVHDFDAPYRWTRSRAQNPAKCANTRDGNRFTLEINGAQYPGTPEGFAQLRRDCIGMTRGGSMSGHKGDPRTGYAQWTDYFSRQLKR